MKRWLYLAAAVLALAATPAIATASQDTVRYGPINSSSTDSGTCGNDWANDTYTRKFEASTVRNSNGTYTASESFIAGRFVTIAGSSPGACETLATTDGMIRDGVTGTFNGTYAIVVSNGIFNSGATCDTTSCGTTADFIATVYGEGASYDLPSWEFIYHANGPLMSREWHNTSTGNTGDVRSS